MFVCCTRPGLQGLGPPTNVYGDHAITEVWLEGAWRKVDSYTVDAPLYAAGQAKLAKEGAVMGWGVHQQGVNSWDGRSDSFVQYIMPEATGRRHYTASGTDQDTKASGGDEAGNSTAGGGKAATTSNGSCATSASTTVGMAGPDTSFSGATAMPDGPMSDRDFGAVLGGGDLGSCYFPLVAASSPFAWQRRWWGRQVFRLLARYCNSRVEAARAGRL